MNWSPSRRGMLSLCGGVVGVVPLWSVYERYKPPTRYSTPPPGSWPVHGYDPAGTWHNPYATAPRTGVRLRWRVRDRALEPLSPVLVGEGTVYGIGVDIVGVDIVTGEPTLTHRSSDVSRGALVPSAVYRNESLILSSGAAIRALTLPDDPGSGTVRWNHTVNGTDTDGLVPPVTDGRDVVIDTGDELAVVEPTEGVVRWRRSGSGSRPSLAHGTVYTVDGEQLRGFDVETGDQTTAVQPSGLLPDSVVAIPDGFIVRDGGTTACLRADGSVCWRQSSTGHLPYASAPAVTDEAVYAVVPEADGRSIGAYSLSDGRERWRSALVPTGLSAFQAPAVANEAVYFPTADGGVGAVDAASGETLWQTAAPFDDRPISAIIAAGEGVYCSDGRSIYALGVG
ncbi:outer membrane protein assembly factor BamB family protein [Halocatena halophila]|uniref:outer membrane protein assembly factor BamB family protein n=1 Tax=Halocatena halophila TaxID=2814576 RepID=UPI002ED69FA7